MPKINGQPQVGKINHVVVVPAGFCIYEQNNYCYYITNSNSTFLLKSSNINYKEEYPELKVSSPNLL